MKQLVLFMMIAGLTQSCTFSSSNNEEHLNMLKDRKLLQSNLEYLKEEKDKCNSRYYEWKEEYYYDSISAVYKGKPIPLKPQAVFDYQEEMGEIDREIQLNRRELDSLEIELNYQYNYSF